MSKRHNGVGELVARAPSGAAFLARSRLRSASVARASDITPRPLDPVWPGMLWAGKPTLLAGDPGLGKSMLTCDIVARVTTGAPWPCSSERRKPADVVMLSAEDDAEDTIVPRLIAAGADLKRVHIVRGIVETTDDGQRERWLSLESHTPELGALLASLDGRARLIVIDPLSAYLGRDVDSHNEGDVRSVLALLAGLAAEHHAAVLAVRHLRKSESSSAQAKIIGSIAFTAAARAVFVVARDPTDEGRRLVLCAKNNLAPETSGYSYTIATTATGTPHIVWGDERETRTADEILGATTTTAQPVEAGAEWIMDVLAEGPVSSTRMRELAAGAGHAWRTIERAKKQAGVVIERGGGIGAKGYWQWRLANPAAANSATPATDIGGLSEHGAAAGFPGEREPKTATPPLLGGLRGLGPDSPGSGEES